MAGKAEKAGNRPENSWRQLLWGGAAFLLLLPLVAMQFTQEVSWDAADFVVFGAMLAIAGGFCELAVMLSRNSAYRVASGIAVGAGFLLVWANVAVGVIGDEGNPINLMFFGVLAVGFFGALIARFRPMGMALAMAAMALAQLAVAGVGFYLGERYTVFLMLFWVAAWALSAVLFRRAAEQQARAAS